MPCDQEVSSCSIYPPSLLWIIIATPSCSINRLDAVGFRGYFTEGSDPALAEQHVQNSVYYRWLLRQMALFYGCPNNEEASSGRAQPAG